MAWVIRSTCLSRCYLAALLVMSLAANTLAGVYDSEKLKNANHIFNAVHSSMRQWGSTLNHNGMSLFLATVPKGTLLYHGKNGTEAVTGMEWVAFEREHALHFALAALVTLPFPPESPRDVRGTRLWQNDLREKLIDQRVLTSSDDFIWFVPGHLHTYTASRDLQLLYLDGTAAAKSSRGTLDVTDLLLLNSRQLSRSDDHERGRQLCEIAARDWGSRIDGFIRMETGFEIIICSFASSLEPFEIQSTQDSVHGGVAPSSEDIFNWMTAAANRYDGIGGSPKRVKLDYTSFITAYNYPVELFTNKSRLPRLIDVEEEVLEAMRKDLTRLILDIDKISSKFENDRDWQAMTDMLVRKYANPLQNLVTSPTLKTSSESLALELNLMLRGFIDTSNRDAAQETRRCIQNSLGFLLPPSSANESVGLAERAVRTIAFEICSTLVDVLWSLPPITQVLEVESTPAGQIAILPKPGHLPFLDRTEEM